MLYRPGSGWDGLNYKVESGTALMRTDYPINQDVFRFVTTVLIGPLVWRQHSSSNQLRAAARAFILPYKYGRALQYPSSHFASETTPELPSISEVSEALPPGREPVHVELRLRSRTPQHDNEQGFGVLLDVDVLGVKEDDAAVRVMADFDNGAIRLWQVGAI